MNPLSCATALAFALTCAASVAVAGETHLSPNTNGGRGALPSGYSALHFTQANGDRAAQLSQSEAPRSWDRVVLRSSAHRGSRLDVAKTVFADLVYTPIDASANLRLDWSGQLQRWIIFASASVRSVSMCVSRTDK